MAPQGVIPGRPKFNQGVAAILDKTPHGSQDTLWIVEMLESIEREDHIDLLSCLGRKNALVGNTDLTGRLTRLPQSVLSHIQADNSLSAPLHDLNCVLTVSTSEVEDDLSREFVPDIRSKQDLELTAVLINTSIAIARFAIPTNELE